MNKLLEVQGLADYLGQYSREFGPESLNDDLVGGHRMWLCESVDPVNLRAVRRRDHAMVWLRWQRLDVVRVALRPDKCSCKPWARNHSDALPVDHVGCGLARLLSPA